MKITKGMIKKGVKMSFILNYLQRVQKHVANRELPVSIHLTCASCKPGTRDISFSVFDYTDGIYGNDFIMKCSISVIFNNGILENEPVVFDNVDTLNKKFEYLDSLLLK